MNKLNDLVRKYRAADEAKRAAAEAIKEVMDAFCAEEIKGDGYTIKYYVSPVVSVNRAAAEAAGLDLSPYTSEKHRTTFRINK